MGLPKVRGGLGFKDFYCFNKALLAKQIWLLWKTPKSLIARIMKAKYNPDASVLEAPLGKTPSFAWRSIQSSIGLIGEGLIWRMGMEIQLGSSRSRDSELWHFLWNLPIPNAEKHFFWRACHEILPTRDNLWRRKVIDDPRCPICESKEESTFHILWQCQSAKDVWGVGNLKFQKSVFVGPSFIQADAGLEAFERAQAVTSQASSLHDSHAPHKWRAPSHGWLKANWDATVGRKNGRLGVGIVIRDHRGEMCATKSWTQSGLLDPTAMEAMATFVAVQMCKALGLQHVQLEGDAHNVVEAVNNTEPNGSCWGHLVADIPSVLHAVQHWEMKHVPREAHQGAHVLAKLATTNDMDCEWFFAPPDCIRVILTAEQSALIPLT
ncbi:uncharacterized protein LOC132181785 [Corylus avellana]|uniref:uncharacterized protein LOC132181785 n=1 Tax=Corylus avellana TaxID=13451 RepID=UPI00286C50B5|nr:uncharacterized protein LOC132181785 [Corylus avellana]